MINRVAMGYVQNRSSEAPDFLHPLVKVLDRGGFGGYSLTFKRIIQVLYLSLPDFPGGTLSEEST